MISELKSFLLFRGKDLKMQDLQKLRNSSLIDTVRGIYAHLRGAVFFSVSEKEKGKSRVLTHGVEWVKDNCRRLESTRRDAPCLPCSHIRIAASEFNDASLSRIHVLRKSVHDPAYTRGPINDRRFYRTRHGSRQEAAGRYK